MINSKFVIKNKEDKQVSLATLDKEASKIWDIPNYIGRWADPSGESKKCDWITMIGWHIVNPQTNWTNGWNNIKCSMFVLQSAELGEISEEEQILELRNIQIYLQPYYKLIDYWRSKGYTPHKV